MVGHMPDAVCQIKVVGIPVHLAIGTRFDLQIHQQLHSLIFLGGRQCGRDGFE